jgi:hypothetical protein
MELSSIRRKSIVPRKPHREILAAAPPEQNPETL